MQQIKAYGITYKLPQVHLIHKTPLFMSEFAARTCYDSFDKSEHETVKELNELLNSNDINEISKTTIIEEAENEINAEGSKLLHQLSHVYFHESTLEHVTMNFIIKNTSRGVLQELARHRIASYSVQSTRYTLSDLVNWFVITKKFNLDANFFINKIDALDIFITNDKAYGAIEIGGMFNKLNHQFNVLGADKFYELTIAKSLLDAFKDTTNVDEAFTLLSSKAKKNVGDVIKGIVTDNMSVDLGFSINLRSLKNFMDLRLSGAAYWQIQLLAYEIYKQIPESYLDLIVKDAKREQFKKLDEKIKSGKWE